ncbi:LysR family transcriptional regulator [Streptomyces sp. NPDC057686]|uniref:LysR family transcriptional regulator n=1 Tax=Streptomyces sp. NPDC057686 TaxID=3346212 RepID=UPI0036C92862
MDAEQVNFITGAATVDHSDKRSSMMISGGGNFDNHLTFQKLEVFCTVVDLGGVSRAARHLCVAQPVVMEHLKSLEHRLGGTSLLRREGRNLKLTPAGRIFYRWAKDTIVSAGRMICELESTPLNKSSSQVTVSASESIGSYILPQVLIEFYLHRRENVEISLVISDTEQALSAVERRHSDLAITSGDGPPNYAALTSEIIGRERIVAVAAPGYPILPEALTGDTLEISPLIRPPRGQAFREHTDQQLSMYGIYPRNEIMGLGHPEAMKRADEAGIGICLIPLSSVERELSVGSLRQVKLKSIELTAPIVASIRKGHSLHETQIQLLDEIRQYLSDSQPKG